MLGKVVWDTALAVIGALGGGALIVFGLAKALSSLWIQRVYARESAQHQRDLEDLKSRFLRDAETHRTALKKSEFLFQKEFEAASAFVALVRDFQPKTTHPDADWGDALEDVARHLAQHESSLQRFLATHGAALTPKAREAVTECLRIAYSGKFPVDDSGHPSSEAIEYAQQFWDKVHEVESLMIHTVRSQAINNTDSSPRAT